MDAMTRLMMMSLGGRGSTMAHEYVADSGARPPSRYNLRIYDTSARVFKPNEKDRIILFRDGSGAYVHDDGLVTPMGDIRHETDQWPEVANWQ